MTGDEVKRMVLESAQDWLAVNDRAADHVNFEAIGIMVAKRLVAGKSRVTVVKELAAAREARDPRANAGRATPAPIAKHVPIEPSSGRPASVRPASFRGLQGDFLNLGQRGGATLTGVARRSTLMHLADTHSVRQQTYRLAHERGHTCLSYYLYNEQDGGWDPQGIRPFNGYTSPARTRRITREIVAAGLIPIPWLLPDDAPQLHGPGGPAQRAWQGLPRLRTWGRLLSKLVDDGVRHMVLGLELNEYMNPQEMIQWGNYVRTQVGPDIGLVFHFTTDRPAASPVRENKTHPGSVPDPYGWEGAWWQAVRDTVRGPVALAYQTGYRSVAEIVDRFQVIQERADGGHGWHAPFALLIGEIGGPDETEDTIEKRASAVGTLVEGSLHGRQHL